MSKLTPARQKALEWIAEHEPVSRFPIGAGPTLRIVKRLEDSGLVRCAGREPGMLGFTRYELTDEGRACLETAK
jgi:DNA-binding PadR family transcriptional regulator